MPEEIKRPDGSVFTPIKRSSEFDGKDLTAITDALNKNPLYNGTIGYTSKTPIQPQNMVPSKLDDTNDLMKEQNDEIKSLKSQLEDSYIQLKQLNDKTSSQTLRIVELQRDLKEEREKNAKLSNKLSKKDWKNFLLVIAGGLIVFAVENISDVINWVINILLKLQ